MRSPNKSRSRNKNNNRRPNNAGSVVNRVFDSNGPQGRVRGTPNQIIEKYQSLAQDAMLAGDRVEAENFSQHAEHYIRLMAAAQAEIAKEQAARLAEQEARQAEHEARQKSRQAEQKNVASDDDQPDQSQGETRSETQGESNLSDPRDEQPKKPRRKPAPRSPKVEKTEAVEGFDAESAPDFLKVIND